LNIENKIENKLKHLLFEMSFTEEIAAVKAKIEALEQQLTSPLLSEQKEHDIQQRIIAKENQLTELYKQNAPTGKKYSVHTIIIS
jgi:hypothetical protein